MITPKDKLTQVIAFRLSKADREKLDEIAIHYQTIPSEVLRQLLLNFWETDFNRGINPP